MSQENVEVLRRVYGLWLTHRKVGLDLLADDVEWVNPHDAVEPGVRRGVDGFNEGIKSAFNAWEEARFEIDRVIDNGDEVVALGHFRGRGRAADIEVTHPHGEIWTFRDGRVIRMRWFQSHSDALEAAGLRE